ncbi:MAG: hypothetical protein H6Q30_2955 [Bacteroidetes bacterium]|nr:hypothetical protein [Bacteroidota bacterium]
MVVFHSNNLNPQCQQNLRAESIPAHPPEGGVRSRLEYLPDLIQCPLLQLCDLMQFTRVQPDTLA